MDVKGWATGAVITLLVGGSAYTFSQGDVTKHFAADTGMSQEQAEQYVENVSDDDLVAFDELGANLLKQGTEILGFATEIDCTTYEYEWESPTVSCASGKQHMRKIAQDFTALGHSYETLALDTASPADMAETIRLIDNLNADLKHDIVVSNIAKADLEEIRNTNSYNKAMLEAAMASDQ
ncbi:MAG: hypothetical protein QOE22_224 [Candidatus Parcubacteria bacterium]|jgi:hypothetical protein|nr:hypothetical protein [Candidatus Parcubacteria bacterium]